MNRASQRRAVLLVLLASVNGLWLLSPPPRDPADVCGTYVAIGPHLGFLNNCDAIHFVELARAPAKLFERKEVRQSRPLFVWMGTVAGYPVARVVEWVRPATSPTIPYYIGYVILNVAFMIAAVLLFDRLLDGAGVPGRQIVLLAVPLICNDVSKLFFWTAHTQIFNILAPLLIVAVTARIATHSPLSVARFLLVALALGVSLLAYGTFVVFLPAIVAAQWVANRRHRAFGTARFAAMAALATLLFLVPTAIWIAVVINRAGMYYNHEMVWYRQLVWIADAWHSRFATLAATLWRFSAAFLATLWQVDVAPFIALAIAVWLGRRRPAMTPLQFACILAAAILLAFFWLLGFYQPRLTFAIVPPLLCYIGVTSKDGLAAAERRRSVTVALWCGAAAWIAYHVAKYGPFR